MASGKTKKQDQKELTSVEEKEEALKTALQQIEKKCGKGSIMRLGDDSARLNVEAIPTGSISLDIATGIGGVVFTALTGFLAEAFGMKAAMLILVSFFAIALLAAVIVIRRSEEKG